MAGCHRHAVAAPWPLLCRTGRAGASVWPAGRPPARANMGFRGPGRDTGDHARPVPAGHSAPSPPRPRWSPRSTGRRLATAGRAFRSAGRASLGADHIGARAPGGSHDLRLRGRGVTAPRAQGAPLRGPARGCRGCRASGGGGGRGRAPASRQPRPSSGTGGAPRRGDGRRAANPRPGERSALACIPWLARGGSGTTRRGDGKAGGA